MARFSDALNRSMEEIKRPPPLPLGHYIFRVVKMPEPPREIQGKPYEILTIPVAVVSVLDDVDETDLAEFGKVVGTSSKMDFIFNTDPEEEQKFEGTLNRLKNFMSQCGIDADEGELKAKLAELPNTQFIGEIGHRTDPNDDALVYAEIRKTSAI